MVINLLSRMSWTAKPDVIVGLMLLCLDSPERAWCDAICDDAFKSAPCGQVRHMYFETDILKGWEAGSMTDVICRYIWLAKPKPRILRMRTGSPRKRLWPAVSSQTSRP